MSTIYPPQASVHPHFPEPVQIASIGGMRITQNGNSTPIPGVGQFKEIVTDKAKVQLYPGSKDFIRNSPNSDVMKIQYTGFKAWTGIVDCSISWFFDGGGSYAQEQYDFKFLRSADVNSDTEVTSMSTVVLSSTTSSKNIYFRHPIMGEGNNGDIYNLTVSQVGGTPQAFDRPLHIQYFIKILKFV